MIDARRIPIAVRLPGGPKGFLFLWLLSELLAFVLVAHAIGLGGAVLLGLCTTVLGIVMLRRVGVDATKGLRRAMLGAEPPDGALLDGMLSGLGAVLLILPGFMSDLAGLALATPSVRGWAARFFNGGPGASPDPRVKRSANADVIDLQPEDWRIVDKR